MNIYQDIDKGAVSGSPTMGTIDQGFGSAPFKPADPDLLTMDLAENTSQFKMTRGKFINNASNNRIP